VKAQLKNTDVNFQDEVRVCKFPHQCAFFTTQYNLSFLKCLQLGRSALECAVKGGHTGIAELLLKSGAKPDLENSVVSDNSIIFCDL
jgi:hypothetical protein